VWVLVGVLAVATARASDPLNSSDKKTNSAPQNGPRSHNEFNILPVAGGTTDIGFGGGYFSGLAHVREGYDPYAWNIESAGLVTFKGRDGGGVLLPYQDVYAKLTVPKFLDRPIRLEIRPSYTWETTLGYYGMGNASLGAPRGEPATYHEYGRLHPELALDGRWRIRDHLAGRVGVGYSQNWLQVPSHSKLADDASTGSALVKRLLGSTDRHAVLAYTLGIQWDNRDNEVSTHAGIFQSLNLRISPISTTFFPYQYGRAMSVTRVFIPIWKPRITLALRVVGDLLFGAPPFYELSRFDDTYALGGMNGVRGIPGQRYYGKVKALGNVELRSELASFQALGKPLLFGVVAFFDAGRVWADTTPHPELDGTGLGLKYGVGGGLRLQSGSAFVLRADIAWSPDATPIGGYFAAGQLF
jgi:outer membrane protein assembly factor BamA